jgi:hypothetical protein
MGERVAFSPRPGALCATSNYRVRPSERGTPDKACNFADVTTDELIGKLQQHQIVRCLSAAARSIRRRTCRNSTAIMAFIAGDGVRLLVDKRLERLERAISLIPFGGQ